MNKRLSRIVSRYLKQSSEMNLVTNYDDTLLAMAELEGVGWLESAFSDQDEQSVNFALKQIDRVNKEIAEYKEDLKTESDPEEIAFLKGEIEDLQRKNISNVTIYGSGGYHRYFVKANGEVIFSAGHATNEDTQKAKDLGFKTWGGFGSSARILRVAFRYTKQSSKMNLLTNYDDTLLAMAEIEGDWWLTQQLEASESKLHAVPHALKRVKEHQQKLEEYKESLKNETDPDKIESTKRLLDFWGDPNDTLGEAIYGTGGWNRWFVTVSGDVVFSRMHGKGYIDKVKELGFEIFN